MKRITVLFLGLIFTAAFFSACSSDDTVAPVAKYSISGVVSDGSGIGVANVSVNLSGAASNSVVTGTDGTYKFENLEAGNYLITPMSNVYYFNVDTISISGLNADKNNNNFMAIGIYGTWVSEGANLALLLAGPPFNVSKITATFNTNGSYTVVQVDSSGASIDLTGTFTIQKSSVATIYNIVLDQATPSVLTATGIFQIDGSVTPFNMQYEVVQTTPDIGVAPPTPAGGFGSTGGGAFGTMNIQKYVRQ